MKTDDEKMTPVRETRRVAVLALALVALLGMSACLFDTRDADPPDTGGAASVTLNQPQKVFVAIEASFEKDNDSDYERATSESFRFYPLLDDSLDQDLIGSGVYDNWTKQVELDVLNLLLSENTLEVTFSSRAILNQNTFVRFETDYVLTVITPAQPPDTTEYAGQSQIDVRNEGGNWRMTQWKDLSTAPGVRTWGYLRGISRLRLNP